MNLSERPAIRFAHLTDLHFTSLLQNRYPTGPHVLEMAIADLNQQDLDFVVFTGDMFNFPERLSVELPVVRAMLSQLRHPYYMAFGNHDVEGYHVARRKRLIMDELGDGGLSLGSPYYSVPVAPGVRLIMLDSTDTPDEHYLTWRGHFSAEQAEWLAATLRACRDELVILGIHHPPSTPYPLMGALKFEAADEARLRGALGDHAHAPLLLCGHFHLSSCLQFGPTTVLIGPSLVEHPHQYRVIEVSHRAVTHEIHYRWRKVTVDEGEDAACAVGTAMRHIALNRLSVARHGHLRVARAPAFELG